MSACASRMTACSFPSCSLCGRCFICIVQDGELAVLDPRFKEEAAQAGRMTVVVNAHKEVCAVQKLGGVPLPSAAVCSLNDCS